MALDTRDRRASALAGGLPWRAAFPAPDGGLDAGDRLHLAGLYRGIDAGEPLPDPPSRLSGRIVAASGGYAATVTARD